jgi:membrane associated rhomboid family serine protease
MKITPVVKQLLIINIIFFAGSQLVRDSAYNILSLFYFENPDFKFWQPLSSMFMHAPVYNVDSMSNILHIAFNMLGLFMFGSQLEHFWGTKKFLFFYISCGLGACLVHSGINYYEIHSLLDKVSTLGLSHSEMQQILNIDYKTAFNDEGHLQIGSIKSIMERTNCSQDQFNVLMKASMKFQSTVVGASGALYGLMVAFTFMFPNIEFLMFPLPIPIKAKYFIPLILVGDLYMGVTGKSIFGGPSGIAHFAHIGGALIGFIIMWYWKGNSYNNRRWN